MNQKIRIRVLDVESSLRRYWQGNARVWFVSMTIYVALVLLLFALTGNVTNFVVYIAVMSLISALVLANFSGHKRYVVDVDGTIILDFWSAAKTKEEVVSEVLYRMRKEFPQKHVKIGDIIQCTVEALPKC